MDELVSVDGLLGRDGFCVLPLLSEAELSRLTATCASLHPAAGAGFETDFESVDADFKRRVAAETAWVWDRLPGTLQDHRAFMSSFLLKWPTDDSQLDLHADWSYVDERRWRTLAVWIPLVDTGPDHDNGTLMVVPGSHRLVRSWRGTSTPPWYGPGEAGFTRAAIPVAAPAGHAVIFDNRLLHYSPPNRSTELRPVLAGALAPSDVPLIHVVGDGDGGGRILAVDDDFFCRWSPSALRSEPPTPTGNDLAVSDLVDGELDPWALAADHDIEDPTLFSGATAGRADQRWSRLDSEQAAGVAELAAACRAAMERAGSGFAPLSFGDLGGGSVTEAVLIEAARPTPLGRDLDVGVLPGGPWAALRVLRLPPGCDEELVWPSTGDNLVALAGPSGGAPPVLIRGEHGWTSIDETHSSVVLAGRVRVINRADRAVDLFIAEPTGAGSWSLRLLPLRYGSRRQRHRQAVELAEAVTR